MKRKNPERQLRLLKGEPSAYGGELLKTRKGRARGRPLGVKNSMHLVLRSSRARGDWSFRRANNRRKVEGIIQKFASRNAVQIISLANVGNHIHMHIRLPHRASYRPFIRAITAAIAMAITGVNKWTRDRLGRVKFWDYRPYTRIIIGHRAWLGLRDYIRINQLEGFGYLRAEALVLLRGGRLSSSA